MGGSGSSNLHARRQEMVFMRAWTGCRARSPLSGSEKGLHSNGPANYALVMLATYCCCDYPSLLLVISPQYPKACATVLRASTDLLYGQRLLLWWELETAKCAAFVAA